MALCVLCALVVIIMMNSPLILITVAYIFGIILGKVVSLPFLLTMFLFLFVLTLTFWGIMTKRGLRFSFLAIFILIGLLNYQIRILPPPLSDISRFPKDKYLSLVGQIDDEPRIFDDKVFFTLKVDHVEKKKATGLVSVSSRDTELKYGDKVEIYGKLEAIGALSNPGILSYADYLKNNGITCCFRASRGPPKIIAHAGNPIKKLSIYLKRRLSIIPQKTLPEPYATLLTSIVFGSKSANTPVEIKELYKRAGVAHLLVASGMHLGILVGVCLFVVRSSRSPLWLGVLLTSIVNFLYALMTGFGPSILRAAIMAEIMLFGILFEKEKEIYTSLSIAALVILLFNPKCLSEVGFQLSFAATISLVYIAPIVCERLKPILPKPIATLLSVAITPVLATTPITLFHFGQTSLIGVLTNFLILPWVGFAVVLGFVSTVLGAVFLPLGELINGANLIMLWGLHLIVKTLASLPFAQLFIAPPKLPLIIAYYAALTGGVEVLRRGKFPKLDRFRLAVLSLVILSVLCWNAASSSGMDGLIITVLDVGQGDSILIELPSGKKMLVDGGEVGMGKKVIIPFLRRKGIRKLDMVVLTHPHSDHVGGLPAVLEKIKVDAVLEPGFDYNSVCYRRFLGLIKKNEIKYRLARAGQVMNLGGAVRAQVLHPSLPFLADTNSDCNNVSVVFKMQYGNFSMLFTGDNEEKGEERILEYFSASSLASTILKVGHHGSATSTSDPFLGAVSPAAAIIPCGRRNKFKHPHKTTLDKLESEKIVTFRTDLSGAVVIRSDGKKYSILTLK